MNLPFYRPKDLATDTAPLVHVCEHVIETYEKYGRVFEKFCILWATAPMRTGQDIIKAYDMLDEETGAVVAITDFDLPVFCALTREENNFMKPLFPEQQKLPSSKQPSAFVDNGSMCWVKVKSFKKYGTWLPPKLKGYWMPRNRSVDLDDQDDWDLLEFYYKKNVLGVKD